MSTRVIEGLVRGFGKDGDAVVETPDGVVFAPFGLPGERVRLEEVQKEGKVRRARRLRVLDPSPDRVEPACPYVARCGGCPLMHASSEAQGRAKLAMVDRALLRVKGRSETALRWTAANAVLGYRVRARFAWKRTGNGVVLGLRGRKREVIVDIDRCLVLRTELERAWKMVREELAPHLPASGEIHMAMGREALAVMGVETEGALPREFYRILESWVDRRVIAGASVRAFGTSAEARFGDPREVGADAEGRSIIGEAFGFSQAHAEINAVLGQRALKLAEPDDARVLELFAGHGNLTLGLAARARFVRAVELNAAATSALAVNLDAYGLSSRTRVIAGDATQHVRPERGEGAWDVVVLDPPRTGAREAITAMMGAPPNMRPKRVVYVSCDPATLGRDLETLVEAGYHMDAAEAFDMFPQTAHVETLVRMQRT